MDREEQIQGILEDLLKLEDIYACMVAKKNMVSVIPPTEKFNPKIFDIWEILKKTMDEFFDIVTHYYQKGLGEVYFRLMDYEVLYFILPGSDTALVSIIPALANKGLLEVELENARRKIIETNNRT